MGVWAYHIPKQCASASKSLRRDREFFTKWSLLTLPVSFFYHFFSLTHDLAIPMTTICIITFVNTSHYSCHCLLVHPENCPLLGSFPIRGEHVFSQVLSDRISLGRGWPQPRKFMASCPVLVLMSSPKRQTRRCNGIVWWQVVSILAVSVDSIPYREWLNH